MKIASKSIMRKQVLDEVQKKMILKAAMNFWKEQQKLEKVTKILTTIARKANNTRDAYLTHLLETAYDKRQMKEM